VCEREQEVRAEPSLDKPTRVSVIIPCYNEERYIGKVLANLADQYKIEDCEIIVVDGLSFDNTHAVVSKFIAENQNLHVRVMDNPARNIPAALNIGIAHAKGDIIVRMDAHAVPSADYVRRCVEVLTDSNIDVVGMACRVRPGSDSVIGRAIALAVSHPFGIGDAKYRVPDSSSQYVDTVAFGAFRKTLWEELGGYNENLLTNEDYDFHYRVRRRDGRIFLDTSCYCDYFARPTIRSLIAQYFRYGQWKAQMIKLHPRSIRWRHVVPPLFVASLILSLGLSYWEPLTLLAFVIIVISYGLLSFYFAVKSSLRGGDSRLILPLIAAFLAVHLTWGSSFLLGIFHSPRQISRNDSKPSKT